MRKIITGALIFAVALVLGLLFQPWQGQDALPEGFSYVDAVIPDAVFEVRYFGSDNFVGAPVDGYLAPKVILTTPAASALAQVQADLAAFGLGLKIFDGYRPQQAVDHFVRWAKDLSDTTTKAAYYPDVEKQHLFRDGYIAAKSGHSRGSTVDVTLVTLDSGAEVDMGTPFDFFGLESWPDSVVHSNQVRANRALLRFVMQAHGFTPLPTEWWHFTLANEPHPDTYFNFPVQ